jgi:ApbE superfamily uncharacterized protein (UPF0280 family)
MEGDRFISFQVSYLETDLWIGVDKPSYNPSINKFVLEKIIALRRSIDNYILRNPLFKTSLSPIPDDFEAPAEARAMIHASAISETGPMSAVAGLFSQVIGEYVIREYNVKELVVENGGDIFLKALNNIDIAIYAGKSELSNKIAITIPGNATPVGLCTSSGTVGPSLSFGKADAVMIACKNATIADALATRFGNEVKSGEDINRVLALSENFNEIELIVIIVEDKIGIRGKFTMKPLL